MVSARDCGFRRHDGREVEQLATGTVQQHFFQRVDFTGDMNSFHVSIVLVCTKVSKNVQLLAKRAKKTGLY